MDAQTGKLVKTLEPYFSKLPPLPTGAREFLVKVVPWLALIAGIFSVLGSLSAFFGGGSLVAMNAIAPMNTGFVGLIWIFSLFSLIEGILWLLAFQPLKRKAVRGWNLLFWVLVLQLVGSVVGLAFYFNVMSIIWSIIWWVISFYILLQLKSYYK